MNVCMNEELPQSAVMQRLCDKVGIELEVFASEINSGGQRPVPGATWETDAGLNLWELITDPADSVPEAFFALKTMSEVSTARLYFQPTRPLELIDNAYVWQGKLRYNAMRKAVAKECPYSTVCVDVMTNVAALHVNFSGNLQPFGEDGTFLINVFNDVAPYVAARIHAEVGLGKGHLSTWREFARAERLPLHDRWFADAQEMVSYVEAIPRLISQVSDTQYVILPDETQSINNPLDLGLVWWFMRPKLSPSNAEYLELRYLPSMPLEAAEAYTQLSMDIVETLLWWFHHENASQPVSTKAAAAAAYEYVHQCFPQHFPAGPLSSEEWLRCFFS